METSLEHSSVFRKTGRGLGWIARFGILAVLFFGLLALGGNIVGPYLPEGAPENGPLPLMTALLIVCLSSTIVILLAIHSSSLHGWKLIITISVAYYLVVTVVTQLEAWYFLYGVTISPVLMGRLFLQGIPVAFIFIPIAVVIMGRLRRLPDKVGVDSNVSMPAKEWIWKLALLYVIYLVLYFGAGYFIAWQNPDLRAFYGSPGEAMLFFQHLGKTLVNDPWLIPYQLVRTLTWIGGAWLIIRKSRLPFWQTALIVGLLLSIPQNIGHLLPNPVIPLNSVRMSHLYETASSTFIFGVITTWLLFPKTARKYHEMN